MNWSEEQKAKASLPMDTRPSGRSTALSPHPLNAESAILMMPEGTLYTASVFAAGYFTSSMLSRPMRTPSSDT